MKKILIVLLISLFYMMLEGCKSIPGSTEISDVNKVHGTGSLQSNSQQKQDNVNIGSSFNTGTPVDVKSPHDNDIVVQQYSCKNIECILNGYFDVKQVVGFKYMYTDNDFVYFDLPSTVNGFGNPLIEVKVSTKDGKVYYTEKGDEIENKFLGDIDLIDKGTDYRSTAKADDFNKEETSYLIKYDDNLCTANEDVIFSFKTEKSKKTLSVCVSKGSSYIVYRYGTKEKVELEYPENKENSWKMFTYSNYLRGGGKENLGLDLNYLSFQNEDIEYQVYDEYSAVEGIYSVGVNVIDKTNKKEVDIKGINSSRIGSLVSIKGTKVKTE